MAVEIAAATPANPGAPQPAPQHSVFPKPDGRIPLDHYEALDRDPVNGFSLNYLVRAKSAKALTIGFEGVAADRNGVPPGTPGKDEADSVFAEALQILSLAHKQLKREGDTWSPGVMRVSVSDRGLWMPVSLDCFGAEHLSAYRSWFAHSELARRLAYSTHAWLAHVTKDDRARAWAVMAAGQLIAAI